MDNNETSRVFRDEDGVYRWVYSLPMFKNFSILRTVIKGMTFGLVIVAVIVLALIAKSGPGIETLLTVGGCFLLAIVGVLLISVACYFLVAALYGGSYVAVYAMDDQSITQYQPSGQADKAALIGLVSAVSGAAAGKPGLVMAGIMAGSRVVVSTRFSDVKSLKIIPDKGEIRVHSFLTWYTVYVNPMDFDSVARHMETRCDRARISHA